ncbi:MAG TPA: hypothetical protein VGH54_09505 [Mycobacterium sp.]|jgi:hypothetical protein|uniref:hypothetical protein n=1 Tax=Mycobacterium sp. TaxID=1785 RepID=UPI002F419D1B
MPETDQGQRQEQLLALLQDRKKSTKGRASRRMAICLSDELSMDLADAEQELAAAQQAAGEANATADVRAGGKVAVDPALAKAVKAAETAVAKAEAAADAASVIITFTALKAADYDEVLKEHPPREGNELDQLADYDRDAFPDALMLASASKKVEDADGNLIDMDVADLIAEMSNGERVIACQVAGNVNDRTATFSDANSQNRQRSGSRSNRR